MLIRYRKYTLIRCVLKKRKDSTKLFEEMKKLVKESAGLSFIVKDDGKDEHLTKSFAECTKDELSSVIQSCIEIGMNYNLNLG